MQIELNDERTLYCYMTEDDFKTLNIFPEKLTYGSNSFRRLISLITKSASEMYHFSSEELPMMVEAVPLEAGELFIQITLIEEAEELDPRFAQFAPSVFDEMNEDEMDDEDMEDDIPESVSGHVYVPARNRRTAKEQPHSTVYAFATYEMLITALRTSGNADDFLGTKSSLYYNPESKEYYLILQKGKATPSVRALLASLCEYATAKVLNPAMSAWMSEHCRCLIRANAVSNLLSKINA